MLPESYFCLTIQKDILFNLSPWQGISSIVNFQPLHETCDGFQTSDKNTLFIFYDLYIKVKKAL